MKNSLKALIPVVALSLILLLASCSAQKSASTAAYPGDAVMSDQAEADYEYRGEGGFAAGSGAMSAPAAVPAPSTAPLAPEAAYDVADEPPGKGVEPGVPTAAVIDPEKIIYSANASIETLEFDNTLEAVNALLAKYGAFVESSSIGGNSIIPYYLYEDYRYNYQQSYRTAYYNLRVPKQHFDTLTKSLSDLGNVTNLNTNAQNITAIFTDVESRLKTYRTEESRLLDILAKADTVEDLITVESRLSEVRYELESLTSQLRNWQNQVDYSSVSLNIQEVAKLTEAQPPVTLTYGEQIVEGFGRTLRGVGNFFKELLKNIIIALPVIVIVVIILVVVLIVLKKKGYIGRRKIKTDKPDNNDTPNNL